MYMNVSMYVHMLIYTYRYRKFQVKICNAYSLPLYVHTYIHMYTSYVGSYGAYIVIYKCIYLFLNEISYMHILTYISMHTCDCKYYIYLHIVHIYYIAFVVIMNILKKGIKGNIHTYIWL